MRVAAPEFGPIALIQLRVAIAALCLLPLLLYRYRSHLAWHTVPHLLVVGITNSALPFTLLAFATLHVSAGYTSLLNSSVPMWSALIAAIWLRDWLTRWQVFGVIVGFLGVLVLVQGRGQLNLEGPTLAIIACTGATFSYGLSANYTKRYLTGVHPVVMATLSQLFAALAMLPLTYYHWPEGPISAISWFYVALLGSLCTAFAYILFYRLIINVGPTRTVSVTLLVPVFAMLWGALLLDEKISSHMAVGCAIILTGTLFTLQILDPGRHKRARQKT